MEISEKYLRNIKKVLNNRDLDVGESNEYKMKTKVFEMGHIQQEASL